jgi:hypothetical protein
MLVQIRAPTLRRGPRQLELDRDAITIVEERNEIWAQSGSIGAAVVVPADLGGPFGALEDLALSDYLVAAELQPSGGPGDGAMLGPHRRRHALDGPR